MGMAQKFCCVGGRISCIGAWGVGTPCALPLYSPCLYCTAICDGAQGVFYGLIVSGRFFVVQRVACYVTETLVARHGRGRGARRDPQQGGE